MTAVSGEARLEALRGFMHEALAMLGKVTFRTLNDVNGTVHTMAAMKPYKNRNAYILLCMLKKKMKLSGTSIETLITPMSLGQAGLCGGEYVHQEIKEKGAVCYVDKCPYQDTSPQFCVVMSHFTTNMICEALNSDYECIWTHHLTYGDPYCRYVYRKKGGTYESIDDLGKTVRTIPRLDIPPEDARALKEYVLVNWLDAVINASLDLNGTEKTLEMFVPLAEAIGVEGGKQLIKQNPGMKSDAATVGHLIEMFGKAMAQRGSTQCLSRDELIREITDCPLQIFTSEQCILMEAVLRRVVHSLNPDLVFSYDAMMTEGDSTCKWHVRDKDAKPTIIIKEEKAEVADPLVMLKMRFAKGEISKEEYLEMKVLIE